MLHTLQVADIVAGVIALLLVAIVVLAVTRRLRLPFTVVLVLVGPGLLLSTLIIGLMVGMATPIPFPAALLRRAHYGLPAWS